MEPTFVRVNGIDLAYRVAGAGDPLLLIHAFPLNSAMWNQQITDLSDQFLVIAPDIRGFGQSELGDAPISLDQYAADLVALLDHLGIGRVAVAGLSMGGYIAFALLRAAPGRISKLILADTRAEADTEEGRQARAQNAQLAEREGVPALVTQMLPKLLAPDADATVHTQVRQIASANGAAGVAAALRAMAARPDATVHLGTTDIPALIIVGSADALTPLEAAQAMYRALPAARIVTIDGAGHLSNLEQPAAFTSTIRRFLAPAEQFGSGERSGGTW